MRIFMKRLLNWFISKKLNVPFRGKVIAIPLFLILIIVCCCLPITIFYVDSSLRNIGLLPTYTPAPTKTMTSTIPPTITPSDTLTIVPSNTPRSTFTLTMTLTSLPTNTSTSTETPIVGPYVVIIDLNKVSEYVDIQNIGTLPQNLSGWRIVSERGNQTCWLAGVIHPGETLRVWANNPEGEGYNCGFGQNIWNNSESDPAVLYDSSGIEIDREY